MQITSFDEPLLQFGTSSHLDIRFGLMNYCPLDFDQDNAPKQIRLGIVGSSKTIEGLRDWLEKCRGEIAAKESRQRNLFPKWPGFSLESSFCSELQFDSTLERSISSSEINSITSLPIRDEQKIRAVDTFVTEIRPLLEKKPDVIVCAIPQEFLDSFDPAVKTANLDDEEAEAEVADESSIDFHDLLKAKCLALPRACPIQLVLPATYDPKMRRRGSSVRQMRPLQDEATRAWNFHTALYYKSGGTPWKLQQDDSKLQTCFVGVGFYRTLDRERISTSVAQVFNERGNGVVVRGEPAIYEKEDRQVHLDSDGATQLLDRALLEYRSEHKTMPARVVIHKTSSHNDAEVKGFMDAASKHNVEYCELLSIRKAFTRLFRNGVYPPLRGTMLSLNEATHILYTRGSVEFYATYPGMYMPRTLQINCDQIEQTPRYLAEEILALTKMNWNDTQFDGGLPITIRAARQVGDILKYAGPNDPVPSQYSFYM
tara:strand:+ start:747021 stop:748475 length:1455 start_codon:yes stop_codon:yes gene_type:complete